MKTGKRILSIHTDVRESGYIGKRCNGGKRIVVGKIQSLELAQEANWADIINVVFMSSIVLKMKIGQMDETRERL